MIMKNLEIEKELIIEKTKKDIKRLYSIVFEFIILCILAVFIFWIIHQIYSLDISLMMLFSTFMLIVTSKVAADYYEKIKKEKWLLSYLKNNFKEIEATNDKSLSKFNFLQDSELDASLSLGMKQIFYPAMAKKMLKLHYMKKLGAFYEKEIEKAHYKTNIELQDMISSEVSKLDENDQLLLSMQLIRKSIEEIKLDTENLEKASESEEQIILYKKIFEEMNKLYASREINLSTQEKINELKKKIQDFHLNH